MKLEKCVNILSGYAFKSSLFNNEGKGLPLVRIRDVGRNYSKTFYNGDYQEPYVLCNGDCIIGMDGNFRLAEWNGGKALLNQRVCKIMPNENIVDLRYLQHILPNELRKIEDTTSFVTVKHLSVKKIKEIKIPLPPLEEQKKIVAILDNADKIRQINKGLIKKYDELSQSLFIDMFGDPVTNPMGWDIVTIRDLISEAKYGTSSKAVENGKYTYLRMNNITYNGYMNYSNLKYIDVSDAEKHKYIVKKGDILFNRTNSKELVGKTGIISIDKEMIIAGYLIRVRTNEFANPYYIWAHLNSKWGKLILNNMCKSIVGMANINAQELQNIKILKAPIELQEEFAKRIKEIEKQKAIAEESLSKSEDLFNALMQKAFKGELTQA